MKIYKVTLINFTLIPFAEVKRNIKIYTAQKMKFSIKDFFSNCRNPL